MYSIDTYTDIWNLYRGLLHGFQFRLSIKYADIQGLFHDGFCLIPILLEVGTDWRSKTAGVRSCAGVFGQRSKQVLVLIGDSEVFRHTPNISKYHLAILYRYRGQHQATWSFVLCIQVLVQCIMFGIQTSGCQVFTDISMLFPEPTLQMLEVVSKYKMKPWRLFWWLSCCIKLFSSLSSNPCQPTSAIVTDPIVFECDAIMWVIVSHCYCSRNPVGHVITTSICRPISSFGSHRLRSPLDRTEPHGWCMETSPSRVFNKSQVVPLLMTFCQFGWIFSFSFQEVGCILS